MLNFTWLSDEEDAVLRAVTSRDWRSEALKLGDAADEELAARAVALGAIACHGIRTTQLIGAGYRCPSRRFMARCLERIDANYLYITSANQSHFATGNPDEPAHYLLHGLQQDFGEVAGVLMLAHRDEARARRRYP